jgi:hypothetical protein
MGRGRGRVRPGRARAHRRGAAPAGVPATHRSCRPRSPSLFDDFHIQQVSETKILGGPGQHTAIPAGPPPGPMPAPGTLSLVGLGLPLALAAARRRLVTTASPQEPPAGLRQPLTPGRARA